MGGLDHAKSLFDWYPTANTNLSTNDTHWGHVGYSGQILDPDNQKHADTKSGFYIARNETVSTRTNQWPTILGWEGKVQQYMDQMHQLSNELARIIALSLNLSIDYFETPGIRDEGQEVLFLVHYPATKSDPEAGLLGAGSHTDYDLFTILLTDSNPGLQILHDANWIDVEYKANAFVINIADTLQLWTNGRFKSAVHRVALKGTAARYSMPYFVGANRDLLI